jgi:hypothetical protein
MIRSLSWLKAAVRDLTAPVRAIRSTRIASTIVVVSFGVTWSSPARARRAALSASRGSDFPGPAGNDGRAGSPRSRVCGGGAAIVSRQRRNIRALDPDLDDRAE